MIGNIVNDIWENCRGKLPIVSGILDNENVSVLRDTGSMVIACRKALIPRKRWLNSRVKIKTANGEKIEVPRALITIKTPYICGKFVAVLLDDPPAHLIVVNIEGAKPPLNNDLEIIRSMETRGQK